MCWSPSLQKPFDYFWTKPLEKVGKKEVVYIPTKWIQSHVLFLLHLQHKLHQKPNLVLNLNHQKTSYEDLVDENHHMFFYGTSLNDK